jgi:hypothetical protein
MNQEQEFLKEVKQKDGIMTDEDFGTLLNKNGDKGEKKEEVVPEKEKSEEDDDTPRNRQQRRMAEKLQKERETNIALNARLQALSELKKYAEDNKKEVDPDLVQAFGTTEDGKALTSIFTKKFKEIQESAEERAFQRIQEQQKKEAEEEAKNSEYIDQEFDALEEKYDVDLSGKSKTSREFRNGFIDFVSEISPKDDSGNIIEYADFESSFEAYQRLVQSSAKKPAEVSQRQKELASRSMESGGHSIEQTPSGPMTFDKARRFIESLKG